MTIRRPAFLQALGAGLIASTGIARAVDPVRVAYAGSLATLMERGIGPAYTARGVGAFAGEGKGSVALANLIRSGTRIPDVFVSADPAVVEALRTDRPPSVAWYAAFATTRMAIAYSKKSRYVAEFEAVRRGERPWTSLFMLPGIRIARTDPALDPKGYRVLLVAQLAERRDRLSGFVQKAFGDARNPEQIFPEETALVRLETGEVDGIFAYAVEAISRNLPFIELPPQINLGDPAFAANYASASVTIDKTVRTGALILYALTVPIQATNPAGGADFVAYLLGPSGKQIMDAGGLSVIKLAFTGTDVPVRLRSA